MRAFADKCAKDLVRQMKGDQSLIDEINRNHENLQATGTPVQEAVTGMRRSCIAPEFPGMGKSTS